MNGAAKYLTFCPTPSSSSRLRWTGIVKPTEPRIITTALKKPRHIDLATGIASAELYYYSLLNNRHIDLASCPDMCREISLT